MTGGLYINGFVEFRCREMDLLKCQIIRVMHRSCIVPKILLKVDEIFKEELEVKVIEYDDEFKSPSFKEMKASEGENWVYEHAYIFLK